jgi:hypothetical protein
MKNKPSINRNSSIEKKKVTIVIPDSKEELTQLKEKLTDKLSAHIKTLTEGKTFMKFCLNSSKVESVHAYFSMDFKCFAWRAGEKEARIQPMS